MLRGSLFQNLDNAVAGLGLLEFLRTPFMQCPKQDTRSTNQPTVGVRTRIRNFILQSVASQTSKPQSCFIAPSHLRYLPWWHLQFKPGGQESDNFRCILAVGVYWLGNFMMIMIFNPPFGWVALPFTNVTGMAPVCPLRSANIGCNEFFIFQGQQKSHRPRANR